MKLVIWVQILDVAVCILLHTNALGKGMYPFILILAMSTEDWVL